MRALVVGVLVILGILAAAAAAVYYAVPAHSLPSFLGHIPHSNGHRTKRGLAAAIAAVVLWVLALGVGLSSRGRSSYRGW